MIIKKRKGNAILLLALLSIILTSIFVSIIAYNQNKAVLRANFEQKIQTLDLGYSTPQQLSTILKDLSAIVRNKIRGFPGRPDLERIDIDINFSEYQKLLVDRQKAISLGGLSNPTDVSASIRHRNKNIRAKIRLKGDLIDHWLSHYRMSFRVSLKGKNSILGFRKFSLHKPESRQFPFDHIYTESMQAIGNITPAHNYIRVYVNGSSWGVMNIEEHISKELVEKQSAKESLVVRFGNEKRGMLFITSLHNNKYNMYRLSNPRLYVKLYDSNSSLEDITNRKRLTYISEERLKENHSHLYDIDMYSRTLILASIWNDGHPLFRSNSRHYFNPYTLTLQPIPSDSLGPFPIMNYGFMPRKTFDPFLNNEIYNQVISTEEYYANLDNNFRYVSSSLSSIDDSARKVLSFFPLDRNIFNSNILRSNANIIKINLKKFLAPYNPNSVNQINKGSANNHTDEQTEYIHIVHQDDGQLEFFNMAPDTVFINQIKLGSRNLLNRAIELPPYSPLYYKPLALRTPIRGKQDGKINAFVSYQGKSTIYKIGPTLGRMDYYIPPKPKSFTKIPAPTYEQAGHFTDQLHVRHYENGRIEIFNLIPDIVTLEKVLLDGKIVRSTPMTVPAYDPNDYSPITIETNLPGILDNRITAHTSYQGIRREIQVGPSLISEGIENPLLSETPGNIPFLKKKTNNDWEILSGSWSVTEPLIIQGNLKIQPGTTLNFAENSYLLVNKGSLTADGAPESPIIFGPISKEWQGIYVNRAPGKSLLKNVNINKTKELTDGLLELTGAVTFYRADVSLKNVVFNGTQAEDSLNIVKSSFELDHVKIIGTRSDGIDFDFSDGKIFDSFLENIGGDALDFSGSNVEIINTTIENTKDKAISAGEASKINITNFTTRDIGVGIASKDGSNVTGHDIHIDNFKLHAVMSYMKKDFYDFPSVAISNLTTIDSPDSFSAQDGCKMTINGKSVKQANLDVKQLYQTETMKK